MTEDQARRLLLQTVVMYENDPAIKGVVVGFLSSGGGFVVNWEHGITEAFRWADAANVSQWEPEKRDA